MYVLKLKENSKFKTLARKVCKLFKTPIWGKATNNSSNYQHQQSTNNITTNEMAENAANERLQQAVTQISSGVFCLTTNAGLFYWHAEVLTIPQTDDGNNSNINMEVQQFFANA